MKKLLATLVIGLLVAVPVVSVPENASADNGDEHKEKTSQGVASDTYAYTSQPGDTYTELARKAVQTYGIENKVNLSGAQIVFTETGMSQEAGSPLLTTGEKVGIKKDVVKAWVEKAQKLTDGQKTAWSYYVQFVDFDTRDNGEAKKS